MQRLSKESMNNCFFFAFPIFLLPSLLQEKFEWSSLLAKILNMQRLSKESMNNCFFFAFPIFLLPSLLQEKFTRAQTFINMPYFSFFSLSPPKDVFFFFFLFFHHYLQSFFLMFPLPPIDISMKFFFTIGIMITLHKPPQTPFPLIYSC